jgi:hypothetical protein
MGNYHDVHLQNAKNQNSEAAYPNVANDLGEVFDLVSSLVMNKAAHWRLERIAFVGRRVFYKCCGGVGLRVLVQRI